MQHVTNLSRLSLPVLHDEDSTEVVHCQIKRPKLFDGGRGVCPAYADAVYLGEALDNYLFRDGNTTEPHGSLVEELKLRLGEVIPRSGIKSLWQWKIDAGWLKDQSESLYGLDPAEDVDESNWLEKGHFREPRGGPRIF